YSNMGLKLRVSFWEGRRVNEKLYANDVFRIAYDDGTLVEPQTVPEETGTPHSHHVQPGCPNAPHDYSCGHEGACVFAHHGSACEAVRPVCPACFDEARASVVPDIVVRIQQEGELVLRCSSCEQLSFQFDAELVCDTCHWLVPYVNEELEERYADNGGEF